ncbi:flotillin-2-like isoform X1 [Panonychus citri]|uniref:flotillin-2-like isoform X1 n=1 Tax=Panonychus citri TaxID=50023 RepID=UPI0023074A36|nr:flotillin-2-like isoform X1 [Panonychus citri]
MGNINTVGPNEALIISGGCCSSARKIMVVGGWAWSWCLLTDVQRLSLEVMTLTPKCENVETLQGVPLTVTGVAQCKVMKEKEFLTIAAEQFLGKDVNHIKSVILQTLEGHLRAILGTLNVEDIYRDRDTFAGLVREVASPDVGRMGIEILSFTIKDVCDHVEYLASLGRARIAAVKRDASVGVAQAERDAGIREAECKKAALDVKYSADTKIEDSNRQFQLQKAQFDQEVNTKKAEAQLAYELQAAKMQQQIRKEEMEIVLTEKKKLIAIGEKEVLRKDKELQSTVKLPADFEAIKLDLLANAFKTETLEAARGDAEKIKLIGEAEASAIEAIGKAEAERMRMKAAAYKQYSEAAILSLTLEALPKVAAEVAAPLAKTDEIVLLGGNNAITGSVSQLVSEIPSTVQALTGLDVKKSYSLFQKFFSS